MRVRDGKYACALCAAPLDVAPGEKIMVAVHAASGQPNVRVLTAGEREIHRCNIKVAGSDVWTLDLRSAD
jgi:hypothetical protein